MRRNEMLSFHIRHFDRSEAIHATVRRPRPLDCFVRLASLGVLAMTMNGRRDQAPGKSVEAHP
jgi:hypothetical protein